MSDYMAYQQELHDLLLIAFACLVLVLLGMILVAILDSSWWRERKERKLLMRKFRKELHAYDSSFLSDEDFDMQL